MSIRNLLIVAMSLCVALSSKHLHGENCPIKLEGEQCDAGGGYSVICSFSFPSYEEECAVEASQQLRKLSTWWHWPEETLPGEFGHSNVQEEPPSVKTVCEQVRSCVFKSAVGEFPDMCVPPTDPEAGWSSHLLYTAYSWTGTCQYVED